MASHTVPVEVYVDLPDDTDHSIAEAIVAEALATDDRIYLAKAESIRILLGR